MMPERWNKEGQQQQPRFVSLAVKNAVVYFLLTLVGFALLGAVLFRYSAREIVASSEQQVQQATRLVEVKFASFIQNVRRDIVYLAQSPFLSDYVREGSNGKRQLLSAEYLALLNSKPDYAQIRLIGVKKQGAELIRVERSEGETLLVPDERLQQKGERPYFAETIRLPQDSVYLSAIDLNKEYGAISDPRMPTLRVATPVFRGEHVFGIVIINVNLEPLFAELSGLVDQRFALKITNQEGHFLLHPQQERTFGFEYDQPPAFTADFGVAFQDLPKAAVDQQVISFADAELLYLIQPLFYPKANYQLFAAVGASKEEILADFYTWRRNILLSALALGVLILLLILWYMRRQARELRRITDTMTAYATRSPWDELPEERNDEIGQLARRFREMSAAIEKNISDLKVAKEKVEQAVEEKEMFLENMSHEIRNPIHSMIGMTHLLEKNNPGRHQKAFIDSLKFNAGNLLSLVNDILDYKKLSTGQLTFKPEWLKLRHFLQQIISSHQFSSAKKRITLKLEVDPRLDHFLWWFDPIRLTQVVNNLVINALKFTPENGQVKVRVSLLRQEKDTARIGLRVEDTGMGIAQLEIDKIIRRFYSQGGPPDAVGPTSTGLGLPIVIQLLKMFDSQLEIDSRPGQGSVFRFELNMQTKEYVHAPEPERERLPEGLLAEAHLMIIDDDPLMKNLYEHIFGREVKRLIQYQQLVTLPKGERYDIVVADFYLGQETLVDHLADLQVMVKPTGALYVLSGAEALPAVIRKTPRFAGQLLKPIDPQQLLNTITLQFASQQFGVPDVSPFWEDYDHDEPKVRRAIQLLIQEWSIMTRGLEECLADQDLTAYLRIRHKLITSVRRLKLRAFELILDEPLPDRSAALTPAFQERLLQRMRFYLWWLRWKV